MDEQLLHREFPHTENLIYLNHAAVAPWPRRTRDVVAAFAEQNMEFGAQHYPHWLGVELRLRDKLARLINAPTADDITLVKNTSEALSFVAYGLDWQTGHNIVSSDQEFPSNRIVWESLEQYGVELRKVDLNSAVTPEDALMQRCDKNTHLLTISSVQYATGLRMDLERLGQFCRDNNILFCVDAIQSIGALKTDVQAIQADFVMADGHKWMLAPEGLGVFYCRAGLRKALKLHQYGWHMVDKIGDYDREEWQASDSGRRFECGSPNMLAIHALERSIGLLLELGPDAIEHALLQRSQHLIKSIHSDARLRLLTPQESSRHAGIVTFKVEGVDHQALYQHLMQHDIICAHRGGGIRFSPNFYTPLSQLDEALEIVMRFSRGRTSG